MHNPSALRQSADGLELRLVDAYIWKVRTVFDEAFLTNIALEKKSCYCSPQINVTSELHHAFKAWLYMMMVHTSVHHKTANLLPAWAVKMPQGECFLLVCKWQSEVFRQRLRHEVTALQLFSSMLAHNGRLHYITETQGRVCFKHGKDAREKENDATCCLIWIDCDHFFFFYWDFSLKSVTVKRKRNVFHCKDD